LLFAWRRQDQDAAFAALGLIAAVSVTRVLKAGLPPDVAFVAWAALWVSVGGWILNAGMFLRSKPVAVCGGLAIATAFFDALSWVTASRPVLWSPPVMLADCLVFAAIGVLLWRSGGGGTVRVVERERLSGGLRRVVVVAGRRRSREARQMDEIQGGRAK
jgi:hypothetical protein